MGDENSSASARKLLLPLQLLLLASLGDIRIGWLTRPLLWPEDQQQEKCWGCKESEAGPFHEVVFRPPHVPESDHRRQHANQAEHEERGAAYLWLFRKRSDEPELSELFAPLSDGRAQEPVPMPR